VTAPEAVHGEAPATPERRLPPITELAVAAMALVIAGGIYMAAQIPGSPSLVPAVILLVVAGALLGIAVAALSGLREFAWGRFRTVFGWTLLAYIVIAGMIEYVFVDDGTRGGPLVVLTLMLVTFAVDVPLILAFSVARYQPVEPAESA
jgi:hypothetical protein